ncbi:hypothetical protein HPB52_002020 [Rhipicephalus sanguineus]|uniref:Uncharacterized protein n=1 Tax=Rhipicephalus sanguineus TaxID=34632 RepID=A0A9D4SXY9_RHISA|nr:hypothetical protein HPB52_002020 [Rhipicephalus sanguineus]
MKKARLTSFNESVLEQVDSNGDIVKSWCRRGLKSFEAKCVLCDLLEAEDEERRKRKASADNSSVADKKAKLQEEKQCLEGRLESSRAMLQRAQGLIKGGLANKNMEDIECGQVLLAEANDSLTENMTRLADINQKLQQL